MANSNDDIFMFIYISAIRDAVSRKAYNGAKKPLEKLEELDQLKDTLSELINNVLNNKYSCQNDYDKDYLKTAIEICKIINQKESNGKFSFGNSQKLINMMLKYFYITSYADKDKKELFKFCHCPMDGQILRKVWRKRKSLSCNIKIGKYDEFNKGWGNEDFEDTNGKKDFSKRYKIFQQAVRDLADKENMSPLEFDYHYWLPHQL